MINDHKICFYMIVKDEEAVLPRCLASIASIADAVVISDTGSTDNTHEVISHFKELHPHIAVHIHNDPWVDFATNRTIALDHARGHTPKGYLYFTIDADDYLVVGTPQLTGSKHANCYTAHIQLGELSFKRVALVNRGAWHWEGVVHEYLEHAKQVIQGHLEGVVVVAGVEGSRSKDPNKYLKDSILLRDAINKGPTNTRYIFYYARSLEDHAVVSGRAEYWDRAADNYQLRASLPEFEEERWYADWRSLYCRIKATPPRSLVDIIKGLQRVIKDRPHRAEPALELAKLYRLRLKDYSSAYAYAALASALPMPRHEALFVDSSVYAWAARDELAVNAYWLGLKEQSKLLCEELLQSGHLPTREIDRVKQNLAYAVEV